MTRPTMRDPAGSVASHDPAILVLGPVRLETDGATTHLPPAQRRLLAILSHAAGGDVDVETLIDQMWGDEPPPTARTGLQVHISALRRHLPGDIVTTLQGYRLNRRPTDLVQVEHRAGEVERAAERGQWSRVLQATSVALGRWTGTPYAEIANEVWAIPAIHRIGRLRSTLVGHRLHALLELQRHAEAADLARLEVGRDPLDEDRWGQLIRVLHRAGRPSQALRAYREADEAIRRELGVPPGPTLRDLEQRIWFDDPAGSNPVDAGLNNLPVLHTSFIGRDRDLRALEEMLVDGRVVTLVGPPGVGKTRLAVEVARLTLDRYPDGVWFCSLVGARHPLDVLSAVTAASQTHHQVGSLDELADRLSSRRTLLILDNCEHVIEPSRALAGRFLSAGGPAHLLATSRRALSFDGEQAWSVDPLGLPSTAPRPALMAEILASPSVQLFVDRAEAADPTFRLSPPALSLADEVCRDAAGIPLAIELVASWLPAIGVADLRGLLGPDLTWRGDKGPHGAQDASLRSALDRSIDLLGPLESRLLCALAVFRGPFGLADASAVCGPGAAVREVAVGIAHLVEASLAVVERRPGGHAVYRLLPPIREYLVATGPNVPPGARAAFVEHYLRKARDWCPDPLQTGGDLRQMDDDIDNVREALDLALDTGRADSAGHAIRAIQGYFYDRYQQWEGNRWMRRALELVAGDELRGWLLRALGSGAHNINDVDAAARHLAAALRQFRRLGHRDGMALSLLSIAQVHATRGSWTACGRAAERARRLLGPRGNRSGQAVAAYYIGESLASGGDVRRAVRSLARAGRLFEETGQPHRAAYALSTLVIVSVLGGLEEPARRHAARAVELARQSGSSYRLARALAASGALEAVWGDDDAAYRLLDEAAGHLGPLVTDVIGEFALPAGFLLRRRASWVDLVQLVVDADTTISGGSPAIGVLWQSRTQAWLAEARAHGAEYPREVGANRGLDGEGLARRILAALSEAGPARSRRPSTGCQPRRSGGRARR